ncbi:DNA topoisomerase I [Candidatus Micrarchaeota archaeon]|nr:DNA topoisomerase I [Candidatus Micrarchaeota archaeon]
MTKMLICEKPKVARTMAYALAEGKVTAKRKYGVAYYEIERNGERLLIVSAVGHVYTLAEKTPTRKYPVFDIEWKPAYQVDKSLSYTRNYIRVIEELAPKTDEVVSACDYDIEGSLIAWNVIRFACKRTDGKRMKFSALTRRDLIESYENMGNLDYTNAYAGEARHILDWFYGINLSRALMISLQKQNIRKTLSIGRIQGPALAILAQREIEIREFTPEPYYQIWALHKKVKFIHEKERFTDKKEFEKVYNKIKDKRKAKVLTVDKKIFKMPPKPPFDLTSLQVEAYRVFGFQPAKTLEYAQTLYEASMISYPRTSSQKLPAKLGHKRIIKELSQQDTYAEYAEHILESGRFRPYEGKKDDPAHPAIHPLGPIAKVGKNEMKLYDLIVRRYLACFYEYAERETQTVKIDISGERFKASGKRTITPGWITPYKYAGLEETEFPGYREGMEITVKLDAEEKMTKPPNRYTPASLVSELEKRGLGTKATRAVVVETLYDRQYIEGTSIKVTPLGMAVYETLKKYCPEILDEKLTRKFEYEMERIMSHEYEEYKVIEEGKETLIKILKKFKENEDKIGKELAARLQKTTYKVVGKCPNCDSGHLVIVRSPKTRKQYVSCDNFPKCPTTYPLPQNALIEPTGKTCEKCGTPIIKVIRKGRPPFEMCLDPNCPTKAGWEKKKEKSSRKPRRRKRKKV